MFLNNILALCRKNGISVSKLEREVGLGNGTVSSWGKRSPSVENANKVAKYFGVTVDSLLAEKGVEG